MVNCNNQRLTRFISKKTNCCKFSFLSDNLNSYYMSFLWYFDQLNSWNSKNIYEASIKDLSKRGKTKINTIDYFIVSFTDSL